MMQNSSGRQVRLNLSISEQIYEHLRGDIMDCTLMPGDRLLVAEIARRFDVSQAPVRDALEKLKQDNLVDSRPNRGVVVSQITKKKMQELFDVRALLEGYAARKAAERLRGEDLRFLEKLVADMELAVASGDKWNAAMSDLNFHGYLYHLCDNQVVADTWDRIADNMIRYMTISQQKLAMDKLATDHRILLDALKTRVPQQVEQAFNEHIGQSLHMEILSAE